MSAAPKPEFPANLWPNFSRAVRVIPHPETGDGRIVLTLTGQPIRVNSTIVLNTAGLARAMCEARELAQRSRAHPLYLDGTPELVTASRIGTTRRTTATAGRRMTTEFPVVMIAATADRRDVTTPALIWTGTTACADERNSSRYTNTAGTWQLGTLGIGGPVIATAAWDDTDAVTALTQRLTTPEATIVEGALFDPTGTERLTAQTTVTAYRSSDIVRQIRTANVARIIRDTLTAWHTEYINTLTNPAMAERIENGFTHTRPSVHVGYVRAVGVPIGISVHVGYLTARPDLPWQYRLAVITRVNDALTAAGWHVLSGRSRHPQETKWTLIPDADLVTFGSAVEQALATAPHAQRSIWH